MTEKILACPYCGGEDVGFSDEEQHPHFDWVWCHDCSAEGPPAETKIEAIEKWNAAANALAKKDESIAELNVLLQKALEQRQQFNANWQAELRRRGLGDLRQDELEAEIEKLKENIAVVYSIAEYMKVARDEARRVAKRLYKIISAVKEMRF